MEISDVEKMKANKDVEGLIEALKDEDWNVRVSAEEALGKIGDSRAVEPLVEALKDKSWLVRNNAAWALGKIKDARALEPLIKALVDKEKSTGNAHRLIGWGVFVLVFTFICFFVTELRPPPEQEQPLPVPQEIPHDVPFSQNLEISNDDKSFIISYDQETKVNVCFQERHTIKGLWSGSGAKLVIDNPGGGIFPGITHSESWGDTLITSGGIGTSSFTPWIWVDFKVNNEFYRKWVNATAEIDVTYPSPSGGIGFINEHDHLVRSFKFFVVSPNEYSLLEQNMEWRNYQVAKRNYQVAKAKEEGLLWLRIFIFIVFTLLGILLLCLGVRLWWRIKHRGKQPNP